MALEVEKNALNLTASNARSNNVGYIYGVTPWLTIAISFSLTGPFRMTIYKTFVPKRRQDDIRSREEPGSQGC